MGPWQGGMRMGTGTALGTGTSWDRKGTEWGHHGHGVGGQLGTPHCPAEQTRGWGLGGETEARGGGQGGAGGPRRPLTGVDEDEGADEGHLALRDVQRAEALREVEDGADELVAAWGGDPSSPPVPRAWVRGCVPHRRAPRPLPVSPALPSERKSSAPANLPSKKTVRFSALKARHMRTSTTSMAPATARDGHRDGGTGDAGPRGDTARGRGGACSWHQPRGLVLPRGTVTSPVGSGWPLGTGTSPVGSGWPLGTVTSVVGPEHPTAWGC